MPHPPNTFIPYLVHMTRAVTTILLRVCVGVCFTSLYSMPSPGSASVACICTMHIGRTRAELATKHWCIGRCILFTRTMDDLAAIDAQSHTTASSRQ